MTIDVVAVVAASLFGLAFGSFANVPIHRWPRDGTVTSPARSACPACGTTLAVADNLPVVSWLLLRGRCRYCDAAIAARYPAVEALTALLFGLTAGVVGPTWFLPAALVLVWSLVVATAIDLEHRIIPNRLTYRLPFVLLALLVPPSLWGPGNWADYRRGLLAAVVLAGGMFAVAELYRLVRGQTGFGMGDVKLMVSLGLAIGWLGWWEVVVLLYAALISAVVVVVVLLATGRASMAARIPFGPYLAVGALVALLAGEPLRGLLGPAFGLG